MLVFTVAEYLVIAFDFICIQHVLSKIDVSNFNLGE